MSKQIRPSVTNPPISSIIRDINEGLLVLAPDFQRKFVWTQEHQEEFIDTILNGLPFPEIYVASGSVDVEKMTTIRDVIDGQQRLTTIRNYITGNFKEKLSKIPSYADLSKERKSEFLSYEIVVRDLGRIDEETIREVFRRINLTKFKLDTIEIQNAIYDGEFIQAAKYVLDHVDLSIVGVVRESEYTRMADLHFCLLLMATIESEGYFAADREVEFYIERYNEEYPNFTRMVERLVSVFNLVENLDLPSDSMWFRKSNFFTLCAEIGINKGRLVEDLREKLVDLEKQVMLAKGQSATEFGEYYSYMYQNTNGRKARIVRSNLFRRFCLAQA
ncbi:DUF262 domain-containing protein [Rhodosalinus sp. FB01]|uniref:DUF262 domain-containing protein n=1 Tax=Rhodosalinus sp. FB01 TaxID=3239194 RepID=UPI003526B033